MTIRSFFFFAAALFGAAAVQAETYSFKEPFSRSGAFHATGKVSLENVNGDIVVEAWDKNEIKIEGEKSAKTAEELKQIELAIDLTDDRANIVVHLPKRSGGFFGGTTIRAAVSFKLMVPAAVSLDQIKTVNSSVDVNGVRGDTQIETVNGGIHARDLGRSARLETVNGKVEASFVSLDAHQELSFKSVNGSIKTTLPPETGFKLNASVVNGHVSCDFPIDGQDHKKARRLTGSVGDGRVTLNAESVNGSIQIARR